MKKLSKLRLFTKLNVLKKWQKLLLLTLTFSICFVGWIIWGNLSLEVTQYTITSDRIPHPFDDFRIVQISDLHNAQFGADNSQLLKKIRVQKPDIIVITGDFVDSRRTDIPLAVNFARQAVQIAPVYYIPGNHEAGIDYIGLYRELKSVGVTLLLDEGVKLEREQSYIHLLGLVDDSFRKKQTVKEALISLMPADNSYTVVLSHRPEAFAEYVSSKADLVLCGHVHGGQFRLPFVGGLYAPGQGVFPKYDAGLYVDGQTNMVISRGIGPSRFPFRLNNRPEIVVVTLKNG